MLEAFISCWVARFGMPQFVTSDRGAQFTSGTCTSWCKDLQVEYITTTAFHPQSNRMLERLHRQIKYALHARGVAMEWESHLLWVLLGLHTAPKEESRISTVEATVGGARPSTCATRRRAASRPRTTCSHPSYQEVLCRGGSFTYVPYGLSRLGV